MTGLNHVLTGAAIGIATEQPLLVVPLAFLSHFLLDVIPHFGGHPIYEFGHKHFPKIMVADGIISCIAVLIILLAAPQYALGIVLGAVFAFLPDVSLLYYYLKGRPQWWIFRFQLGIQWFEKPVGALVEAAYAIFISTLLVALIAR